MHVNIFFNSINLANLEGVKIDKIDTHAIPTKVTSVSKLARADGAKMVNSDYGPKNIIIEGHIVSSSRDAMQTIRDTLLRYLQPQEATLRFIQSGAERNYTATLENVIFSNVGGGYAEFTINFVCADPFGYNSISIVGLNSSSNTSENSLKTLGAPILGGYKAEPTLSVEVSAVSGGAGKYIKLSNPASGKAIYITRTWAANDSLVVNCRNKTVTVEGVAVDYTGTFPTWEIGDSQLRYEDTFTTRTVLISFSYTPRYI